MDRTHRRIYLGHRVGDVTDLYEDFGEGLAKVTGSDAKKLKAAGTTARETRRSVATLFSPPPNRIQELAHHPGP